MRTVLITLSVINGLMGLALLGVFVFTDDNPLVLLALAVSLMLQAGYTLAYMAGILDALEPWSTRALLTGETVALLVGFLGFVSSALHNIDPPRGDYEYGPLVVGTLIATQAATALWVFAARDRPDAVSASRT